ncbi:MAG: aminotransferase class V-fold PLP-dependent enzyme, partial [Bacteroidales bacterium]
WRINPQTYTLELDDLRRLLSSRTRLVAFTHASNVIGTVNPVKAITDLVHSMGALVCVDGVAYAPHRLIDVRDWGVDFYVFSFYKTYGPHYALLYGRREILLDLPGNNHFFIGKEELPYKFQPGNVNFEFAWAMTGLPAYLEQVHDHHLPGNQALSVRDKLEGAFGLITGHEQVLADRLLAFLNSRNGVRIIGQPEATDTRVPTISFLADGHDSAAIVREVDRHRIGIRYGDFYARRLIDDLGLSPVNGVVRVSMVHYNTIEEVDRLVQVLDRIL